LLVQLLGSDKSQIQLNAARTLNHACCNDLTTQNTMRDAGGITALSSVLSPQARDGHIQVDEGLQEWAVLLALQVQVDNIANRRAVGEAGLLNVLAQLLSTPTSEYIKLLLLRSLAESIDAQGSIEDIAVCDNNRSLLSQANITPAVAAFLQSTEASDLQAEALRLLCLLSTSAGLAAPILQALDLSGGDWIGQLEALIATNAVPPEQEQHATEAEHRGSVKFQCLLLLTNLARHGSESQRQQLLQANAARLATPQLQAFGVLQAQAAELLFLFSREPEFCAQFVHDPEVRTLTTLIHQQGETASFAAGTVLRLARASHEARKAVLAAGGLDAFVVLLSNNTQGALQKYAAAAVHILASDPAVRQEHGLHLGAGVGGGVSRGESILMPLVNMTRGPG
jgi:hypothetical protein